MTDVLDAPSPRVDPVEVDAQPLILNDAYFEITGVNLRCLVSHVEVSAENKPVTVTTLCSETDYPGVTKFHLKVTFQQSYDAGAVFDTLQAALEAYESAGTPAAFKTRGYASRPVSASNPSIEGEAIPMPFDYIVGDAGTASQVAIDWTLTGRPVVVTAPA